ncbi:hypothetical protein WL29_23270 [Burkholderia ubonensis]|uniref:Uncharacterized protein n=1 Tax=Burkholderia ubonensis TaxID=101571 RepID=A0A106QC57_9BURK|nr:hypothetical protein [Burkholderia ubonensis]KWA84280.1 hypothetical protein WL29_23270 [Burkholderia ubonensis]
MGTLGLLLLVPLVWPFVAKAIWKHEITLGELATNLAIGVLVVLAGYYGSRYAQAYDVEIHNGRLISKNSETVSCEHSYTCNCRQVCTGSGKDQSCSTTCDTCYEHSYDVDWKLKTEVGDIKVPRVDRQGTLEPPRFSRAQPGDPVSVEKAYQNYIKAAPDSLFNKATEDSLKAQFAGLLPAYPDDVYDLHYVNRVIVQGVPVPDLAQWNSDLQQLLATLGPKKQVNAVVVLTNLANPNFAEALRATWLGGKKNDVVVVLGVTQYPEVAWARVFSWTDRELFKVELRDELQNLHTLDRVKVLAAIRTHIERDFVRKSMKDFAYLQNEIEPPLWMVVLLAIVGLAVSVGVSMYFARNNVRSRQWHRV